jgi:hypothetical protein
MLKMIMLLLVFLGCPHLVVGGQMQIPLFGALTGAGSSQECNSSQLSLVEKKTDTAKNSTGSPYRLGETLHIRLSGACATALDDELAKRGMSEAARLYLDNVAMAGLPVTVHQGEDPGERIVSIHLLRQSQQEENRSSWDTLLTRQHGDYVMKLPLALAIGEALPVKIHPTSAFRFSVVSKNAARITNGVCLLIFVVCFILLIRHPSALRETRNGVYSLGKSQMAFWGLLVILSFLGLWIVTGSMERIPEQVLTLLGISGATGLGSLLITTSKLGDQPPILIYSTPRDFLRDILDDGNGFSLHRMQVVIWTIILGGVFIQSVNKVMSMPEFPETLLMLMGISNGLYLGFKFPEKVEPPQKTPVPEKTI